MTEIVKLGAAAAAATLSRWEAIHFRAP